MLTAAISKHKLPGYYLLQFSTSYTLTRLFHRTDNFLIYSNDLCSEKKETLTAEEWSVDQQMLSKLKEQYRQERHRDKSGASASGHISDRKSTFLNDHFTSLV